jgi:hypothetical protein
VKQDEPAGKPCTGCLSPMAGTEDDELRAAGAIFLASVGWFCTTRCERQYRLRFRIQPDAVPVQRTPAPRPPPLVADPVVGAEPAEKSSAAETLAEALRQRRRTTGS